MEQLFTVLTNAITGTPFIALGAAFAWGILSILLSPCHLSSIPLVIGFISDQGKVGTKRAFQLSVIFALGILATIAVIGLITSLLGRMLGDIGLWANYMVAGIFVIVGLYLLGVIRLPEFGSGVSAFKRRKGFLTSFVLGLIFGVALGPCAFAYMMPILGVVFTVSSTRFLFSIALLGAFALGHCGVIAAAGTSAGLVQQYLNWNERSKGLDIIRKVCGVLLFISAAYLIISRS